MPLAAEARLYVLIDQPSEHRFPIAIADLIPEEGGKSREWSEKVSQKIRDDLELTGLFELIDPSSYPRTAEALSPNPATIQFGPWSLIGAQALVHGSYASESDGMRVSLHLYDPYLGQHLVGRKYQAREKEIPVVAHHFADEILKTLTGERGAFSTKIAFTCLAGKKKEICSMDMDGENQRQLTHHKSISLSPAWSPSGNEIAYSSYAGGGNPEIHILSTRGESRRITANETVNLSPVWSPQGFLTFSSALKGDTDIYLMDGGGKITRRLTESYGIDINPSWSPDGRSIVFASERAGRLHLFRADATGSGVRRLTFVGYHNDNPAWSPRGDKIVFQGMDMGLWDLFIMNADGSMLQRLTASTGNNESPSWAPNGRFITFSSDRHGSTQIFIMREDGSNQTRLGPKKGGATQPAWSPWFE